jgi:hypothetical protein
MMRTHVQCLVQVALLAVAVVQLPLTATATAVVSSVEAVSVPYPQPAFWSHAWPFDVNTAVVVASNITVVVSSTSSPTAVRSADPLGGTCKLTT